MHTFQFHERDEALQQAIANELARQQTKIELIASENITSEAVMAAQGSVFTNKYAEGYPAKRYYAGCEYVDVAEKLAQERACKLFGCKFANVQPHSGSTANQIIFNAFLKPGDKILGMSLDHGGHLTHGHPVNFSGLWYDAHFYGVRKEDEQIDYEALATQAKEVQPKLITIGASAYPREINFAKLREIADGVNAYLLADIAHIAGLIAAGVHPSPVPYADFITTTTHKTLRGPRGGMIMTNNEEHHKAINKSLFPGMQGGPLMHVIAAKAVAFGEALEPSFKQYQQQIVKNAQAMATALQSRGWRIISGGTDNHLILIDVNPKGLTGKDAEVWLDAAGLTTNKNTIPFDTNSPFVTSGIRAGSPAGTTRGFKEAEFTQIGNWMADVLDAKGADDVIVKTRQSVAALCAQFPIYKG